LSRGGAKRPIVSRGAQSALLNYFSTNPVAK